MKIIEALKELPILEKRIAKQYQQIRDYSSYGSHVGPTFATQEEQINQVKSLIQSNEDLVSRYLKLRRVLNKTNCAIEVTIGTETLSIIEWITMRKSAGKMMIDTYNSQSILVATQHINTKPADIASGVSVGVVRCFDEKEKNASIAAMQAILEKIDASLEMVNATTDLVEEV